MGALYNSRINTTYPIDYRGVNYSSTNTRYGDSAVNYLNCANPTNKDLDPKLTSSYVPETCGDVRVLKRLALNLNRHPDAESSSA
jgi:hypothetical protein